MTSESGQYRISRLSGEFVDRSRERAFREANFAYARRLNRVTACIAAALFMVFAVFEYSMLGMSTVFYVLLGLRAATIAGVVLVFAATRRADRLNLADWSVFAYLLWLTGFFLFLTSVSAPDGSTYPSNIGSFVIALMVLGYYVFFSTRLFLNAIAAITASALYIVVGLTAAGMSAFDAVMEGSLLAGCNVIGYSTLYRIQKLRRREYAVLSAARSTNKHLRAKSRELEELTRTLARARDEATSANRSKSDFLAHMSHELRSPLNAIIGFAEVMKEQMFGPVKPKRYHEYVTDIHSSGVHLLAVINDILDLSKSASGKLDLSETVVSLRTVIDASLRLVRERARDGSVALHNEAPPDLPDVRADQRRIMQILINLLTNAVDFTPAGGTVRVGGAVEKSGQVALWVADTGAGIAQSDIPGVLEAYGQGDAAQNRRGTGTGLGLPIAKSMIEQHGGTLTIESKVGEGTTITLRFPADRSLPAGRAERAVG